MTQYCVVVVDGARARFFTLQPAELPELESSPRLVELEDLVNPEAEVPDRELWTEAKTGRNRAPNGGPAHGYDDHRERHEDELERRFANSVGEHCEALARREKADVIVLAAQKRMLGFLRQTVVPRLKGMEVKEYTKDLSKLGPQEIHDHLAREALVPERKPPASRA